jgi:hypothetical protein
VNAEVKYAPASILLFKAIESLPVAASAMAGTMAAKLTVPSNSLVHHASWFMAPSAWPNRLV